MIRWFRRSRQEQVRVEAQLDLRDGLLEARADRIRELERANALLVRELSTYKAAEFVKTALRERRRLAEERAVVQPKLRGRG